jgi:beta-N-acetylhexosaminidase
VAVWAVLHRGGETASTPPSPGGAAEAKPRVARVESGLSRAERVDQVLLLGFDGTTADGPIAAELRSHQLGGVIVGSSNWTDASQGAALVAALHSAGASHGRVPPLIAVAQEGGEFRSLSDLAPTQTELQIGRRGSSALAERWAQEAAGALRNAGFDLDLFPVIDVPSVTSPLGDRAFSTDPAMVAELAAAAVRGCVAAKLACAPLHFPGLGTASQDTDEGPATVSLDPNGLANRDLPAFQLAFEAGAPAVVLSLAFYAAYDPVTPGALAPQVATGLLRDQLHSAGAAITDDLGAGAIRATEPIPQAAVEALAAGADLIQVDSPVDQAGVRQALLRAVATGQIPRQRLADAAARVLELKREAGLLPGG